MSRKYSSTTADYLSWDQNLNLIRRLLDDGDYKMSLLISIGTFWGIRISDILKLKWNDILDKDEIRLIEQKNAKSRDIRINENLRKHITDCHNLIKPNNKDEYIFLSQKGTVYSIQRINNILKELKKRYDLTIGNFSTHTLRKTFGRQIFELTDKSQSELALVKLSEVFSHSSPSITKRYLGITKEEIKKTYELLSF